MARGGKLEDFGCAKIKLNWSPYRALRYSYNPLKSSHLSPPPKLVIMHYSSRMKIEKTLENRWVAVSWEQRNRMSAWERALTFLRLNIHSCLILWCILAFHLASSSINCTSKMYNTCGMVLTSVKINMATIRGKLLLYEGHSQSRVKAIYCQLCLVIKRVKRRFSHPCNDVSYPI